MLRLQTYTGLSLTSVLAIIYYAFHSRGQFYPAIVYLTASKISLVLLLNMGLVVMCILWQLTVKVFLRSLRESEIERLNEQSWRKVIEILFTITIFKQDFSVLFLAMVAALLLIKGLHCLAQKRVEYIETIQAVTLMSHIRIASFMGFLLLMDGLFLYTSLKFLLDTQQASASLLFSFEYMILAMTTMSMLVKYIFFARDMLMEGHWERKSVYTFYLDLIHDVLHLAMYLCFFTLIFINYGVPLHLVRELYETFHSFKVCVADYKRYQKITSNLNERFPDATPEELIISDATCIICREEMTAAKKLICGHLFHVHCLRSWMERQDTCPTCRAFVWPHESGTTTTNRPLGPQTDVTQQASASTCQGSTGSSDVIDYTSKRDEARFQAAAAAAAASIYGRSLVYPSPASLIWYPGPALLAQANGPLVDSASTISARTNSVDGHCLLCLLQFQQLGLRHRHPSSQCSLAPVQLPSTDVMLSDSDNINMMSCQLDTSIKFIEHQIEVLRSQLRCLPRSREGEMAYSTNSVSSDAKGKAIVYSMVTNSGSL